MKVCWYNHYHNGDVFATREIVKIISQQIPGEHVYAHVNHPKILSDIGFPSIPIPPELTVETQGLKIFQKHGIWFINTWIGCYLDIAARDGVSFGNHLETGIHWKLYQKIWQHACEQISQQLGITVQIPNDINLIVPAIQQDFYTNESFLRSKLDLDQPMVLISNGPSLSGQSHQRHDMSMWFHNLVEKYPQVQWIFTHRTPLIADNVFYTQDIFVNAVCDLNEIGDLSKWCKVVVGRNSGPFLFCNRQDTLFDPTKTFIALGILQQDCFPWDMDLPCSFYWHSDHDNQQVHNFIETVIQEKLAAMQCLSKSSQSPNLGISINTNVAIRKYLTLLKQHLTKQDFPAVVVGPCAQDILEKITDYLTTVCKWQKPIIVDAQQLNQCKVIIASTSCSIMPNDSNTTVVLADKYQWQIQPFIFNWPGQTHRAKQTYQQLKTLGYNPTVVNSDPEYQPFEWINLGNDAWFAQQWNLATNLFTGDILFHIQADATYDQWQSLINHAQEYLETYDWGIYSPRFQDNGHYTPMESWQCEHENIKAVANPDCTCWFLHKDIIDEWNAMKSQLRLTNNKYGWGIDCVVCAISWKQHRIVLRDFAHEVFHHPGRGYDSGLANQKMYEMFQYLDNDFYQIVKLLWEDKESLLKYLN